MSKKRLCRECKKLFNSKDNRSCYKCRIEKRQAAVSQATPKWLSPEQHREIDAWFDLAREMRQHYPEKPVVDHIVPLRGLGVCGLHVPWNMQILTSDDNRNKSNK